MRHRDEPLRVISHAWAICLCGMLLLWGCGDGGGTKSNRDARPLDTRPDLAGAPEAGPETNNPIDPPFADAGPGDTPNGQETGDGQPRRDTADVELDTGSEGGSSDGSFDTKTGSMDADYHWDVVPKRDAYVIPTDEQSCVQATSVPTCGLSMAMADIVSKTPGQLIQKAEVTSGTCSVTSCRGGCERLSLYQDQAQTAGSACDLRVTMWDGGQQEVHVALVANPAPRYACCGYPLPPNAGLWVATNPVLFQPNPIFVSSPLDGGNWDAPRFFDGPPVDAPTPSER